MKYTLALVLSLCLLPLAAHAQAPASVSYQGVLERGGSPVDDPSATLTFRLFEAASGGSAVWSETQSGVAIEDGIFSVALGAVNPLIGADLRFNRPFWLEVEEGLTGSTLSPRTPLTATPYALGLAFPQAYNVSVPDVAFLISNGTTNAIEGETQAVSGRGVTGRGTGSASTGLYGLSQGAAGTGVYGIANSTLATDPNYGVFGKTNSATGFGVYAEHIEGHTAYLSGPSYAVFGEHADGMFGRLGDGSAGVRGQHPSGNFGTLGRHDSGAWGRHTGGGNYGYLGTSTNGASGTNSNGNFGHLGNDNYGVRGYATAGHAGYFSTNAGNAAAVLRLVTGSLFNNDALIEGYTNTAKQFQFESDGSLRVYNVLGDQTVAWLNASDSPNGSAFSLYRNGTAVITLDADRGGDARIVTQELEITGGSDLAEHFDVRALAGGVAPEPGTVVSIDPDAPGQLVVSGGAYDPLVAGVVSGAGGVETGLLLRQEGSIADGEVPVALVGRVYVRADASHGAIRPGDLLTTAPTPGHAMRASDRDRAFGAVLGKAITGLDAGTGLVLVLVTLQ
ncbi:MAG: hypothetical protein AAGI91_05705 [Bacteroidota bacterium]